MNETIRVTGVCGSLRPESHTKMALAVALRGRVGVRGRHSPHRASELRAGVLRPGRRGRLSAGCPPASPRDGIILATPEYHGSLSGALKNMLDLMAADEFERMFVALVGMAGGHTGTINSLNTMRAIGRNLHCWVLPQEVSVANSSSAFNEDGTVTDPTIEERLLNIGRQVVKSASVQQKIRGEDFIKMWEGLPTW